LAIALPPSGPSEFTPKSRVIRVVFAYHRTQQKRKIKLAVMEKSDDNEDWTYLQSLSQSFARLGVEFVAAEV
jgi:hypothetical protein